VVNYVSGEQTTIPFDVTAYAKSQEAKERRPAPLGKYTITINSGARRKRRSRAPGSLRELRVRNVGNVPDLFLVRTQEILCRGNFVVDSL
jgi:hypothetical protein